MDVLTQIMNERRAAVQVARKAVPPDTLRKAAAERVHRSLSARLADSATLGTAIVAEVKKASPSAGLLRSDYQPDTIAEAYVRAGAAGISVLTEPRHFLGHLEDLRAVRTAVPVPVLRKDFFCDTYQVLEAAAWGADVVLLIVAALHQEQIQQLYQEARALRLEVLAEVHDESELQCVLPLEEAIIGVNSRNLKTLKTDLATAHRLASCIPADRLKIAESGIGTRADITGLEELGYDGFLVGESLLREKHPGQALQRLLS